MHTETDTAAPAGRRLCGMSAAPHPHGRTADGQLPRNAAAPAAALRGV